MDVTQDTSVDEAIMDTRGHLGEPPSLLVNCAAIIRSAPCHLMDEKTFDSVIDVNLKGTTRVCQAFTRELLKEMSNGEHRGAIVNISSRNAKTGYPGNCQYSASKGWVTDFTKALATDLAKEGVRVNAVLPGAIDTPMNTYLTEEQKEMICSKIPLHRFGRPEEIAEVIVFLLSRRSSFMTGTCVEVTGGRDM